MDANERRVIDELFGKLRQAEAQAGPRDGEAEALIGEHVAGQPAAPYLMAQAIVVQQDALERAQARIKELEQRPAGGGFLSGLFGGGEPGRDTPPPPPQHGRPYGQGGGFLGGAMQTALGVAGGFLIADAISGLLSPEEAAAAEADPDAFAAEDDPFRQGGPDQGEDISGGAFDDGGDFGDF